MSLVRDSHQKKARAGSFSPDDPDRPRWTADTVVESVDEYRLQDGTYLYAKIKGRFPSGDKTFVTGRQFKGSMGDRQAAQRDDPDDFFRFPALADFRKGTGGCPDVLFRLPELARGLTDRPDDPVFITEGEKDANKLASLDLIVTTNPDGALKWKPEYSEWFRDRDVIVLTDNDANGRRRGRMLAVALYRTAKSLKIVALPGLKDHGDVSDWLDGGKSKDDLLAVVEEAPAWEPFDRDDDGRPFKSPDNARLALELLGVTVRYDEFADRVTVAGLTGFGPLLDDAGYTRLRLTIEETWRLAFAKEKWWDIVSDHARRHSFHPVREYLDSLRWDSTPRLDRWLHTYGGAEDSEYVRAVAALPLIAAVRRVRQPGCKFDELMVMEGPQGGEKSTALRVLAVRDDWFVDSLPLGADSKVVMEQIAGGWLVEFAEMSGLNKSDVENVKSQVARQIDKARMSYGRTVTERPRQCVFFGTTNADEYLRDTTGNRRFWPVKVGRFDIAALRRDRDQLWAEAAVREARGESIRLPEHLWAVAGEQQDARMLRDPFFDVLSECLDGHEGKIRAADVWEAVGRGDPGQRTQNDNLRLNAAMQKLGWKRPASKLRFDGRPQNAWVKGPETVQGGGYAEVPRSVVLGLDELGNSRRLL